MSNNRIEKVTAAIAFIEAHLTEKLDLDAVAKAVHYSKYHLYRVFTETVDLTIHHYVQRCHLTEAAKLLVFSWKSIIEIAAIPGYETQQAFTNIFTAMYKQSPSQYRNNEKFYALQLKFRLEGDYEMLYSKEKMKWNIAFSSEEDIPAWMELVRLLKKFAEVPALIFAPVDYTFGRFSVTAVIPCSDQQDQLEKIKERLNAFLQGDWFSFGIILKTNRAVKKMHEQLSQEYYVQLISPDSTRFVNGISITSIQIAKGVEFDEVLVPDVSEGTYDTKYDRSLLYVACTRAMHKLKLFYTGKVSPLFPSQKNQG